MDIIEIERVDLVDGSSFRKNVDDSQTIHFIPWQFFHERSDPSVDVRVNGVATHTIPWSYIASIDYLEKRVQK